MSVLAVRKSFFKKRVTVKLRDLICLFVFVIVAAVVLGPFKVVVYATPPRQHTLPSEVNHEKSQPYTISRHISVNYTAMLSQILRYM